VNPKANIILSPPGLWPVDVLREENAWWVTWARDVGPVRIYSGWDPESLDRSTPAAEVAGGVSVLINGPADKRRRYFLLAPQTGRPVLAAQRRISIQGVFNFRDLGGYPAASGEQVKWGRLYRSDTLTRLTDEGRAQLSDLGVRLVLDFRTEDEVLQAPDALAPDVAYCRLPICHGEFNFLNAVERLKSGDDSWLTDDFMVQGYLKNLEEFPTVWRQLIERLADPANLPLVFHCTGGKDRAGTAAALILLALGVPEATVIEDHQLSNDFIKPLLGRVYRKLEAWEVDPEKIAPYFTAPLEGVTAVIEHLNRRYGSVESYLVDHAGTPPSVLAAMRRNLLG
jgi:protein-tyrosine phosphatase